MGSNRSKVFISYRRTDRHAADQLYSLLISRSVMCWYDPLIAPGANWRDVIVEQLSNARVMVILLSSKALQSDELKKELAVAVQKKVQLLAVRLEDVKPSGAFAYELYGVQWFDIFPDPDLRMSQLASILDELLKEPTDTIYTLEILLQTLGKGGYNLTLSAKNLLYNNRAIWYTFFTVSISQLLLYEELNSPIEDLINNGLSPLKAYGYVVFAVTFGSPFLFLAILRSGISISELPLLVTSLANTVALVLLLRNIYFLVHQKWTLRKL